MSVTPAGMLSRPQPESARAAAQPPAAARTSGASFARIIVDVPYSARRTGGTNRADLHTQQSASTPGLSGPAGAEWYPLDSRPAPLRRGVQNVSGPGQSRSR